MKSKARMHKTLASLAMAMTVTAVTLHWMDPSARAGRPLSSSEIVSMAKAVVTDSVKIKTGQWREVELTTDENALSEGLSLTASRDHHRCHFFIDSAGRPSQDDHWIRQAAWDDSPHTIRIHLERASSEGPNEAQWYTTKSIILALDAALSSHGSLPILMGGPAPGAVIYSSSL